MNSYFEDQFTLQQLAYIALGGNQLTSVNTMVLHSLLGLVLKKLNCENEKVSISGYEAKQIERILQESSVSPITFQEEEQFTTVLERFEHLDEMENQLNKIENQLNEHLIGIRRYLHKLETLEPFYFDDDEYYEICEDLCSTLDPDIKTACEILTRSAFLKNILLHMCHPIMRAYNNIEKKLCRLEDEICELMKRLDATFDNFHLVGVVEAELNWCRSEFDTVHATFLKTLNEIQDILDSKVNKCQMLEMKEYLSERFELIWLKLKKLRFKRNCQRASAIAIEKKKPKTSITAKRAAKRPSKTPCVCEGVHMQLANEQKLLQRIKRVSIKSMDSTLINQTQKTDRLSFSKSLKIMA